MSRNRRYPPEVRERAVALALERQGEHRSQLAATQAIASKFGMAAETLRSILKAASAFFARELDPPMPEEMSLFIDAHRELRLHPPADRGLRRYPV